MFERYPRRLRHLLFAHMTPLRCFAALACCACLGHAAAEPAPLTLVTQTLRIASHELEVRVPRDTVLEVLVPNLQRPRLMTFAPNGDLFIGSRQRVYRLAPPYDTPTELVALNDYPHSVALRDGEMLIARTSGLYRAPYSPGQASIAAAELSLLAELPGGRGHDSRTVRIGPDGQVYVSLGIAGNCSNQYLGEGYAANDQRGGVVRLDESGATPRWVPHASGLRNPIGFDWHPLSGTMYASNNGPDHLGFEQPGEYFSRLAPGSFHGMPWFYFDGREVRADTCTRTTSPRPMQDVTLPAATFPARNAPMDVAFVPASRSVNLPAGDAVTALHGSWATPPDGSGAGDKRGRRHPAVVVVRFEDGEAVRVDDLITGFQLANGQRWLRPVGVAFGPAGALYITSDGGINGLLRLRSTRASDASAAVVVGVGVLGFP